MKEKILIILIVFNCSVLFSLLTKKQFSENFEIYFLNVGQGDATLLKTTENSWALIDAGRGNVVISEIEKINPDLKHLEFLLLTHADLDHTEGALSILDKFSVDTIFLEKSLKKSAQHSELLKKIKDLKIDTYYLAEDTDFYFDNVYFDILWPIDLLSTITSEETNELSISTLISYYNFKIFIAGDLGFKNEEFIVNKNHIENIDVLKVSHHGSKTSTSEKFLEVTSPNISIISVGEKNSYGHPNTLVLDRLDQHTNEIYRTDKSGSIKVEIDSKGNTILNFIN